MGAKDWLDIVGAPISWLLVIVGWYVISRSHDRRESRKEARALLELARKLLVDIETSAYEYYGQEPSDEARQVGNAIKRDLMRFSRMFATLCSWHVAFKDCDYAVVEFRQAVTGGDFETSARAARPPSDQYFYMNITDKLESLVGELEDAFAKAYQRS